jgi:cytochrome c oxidase subunit 2
MRRAVRAGRRVAPATLALLGTACSGSYGMPRGASEQGADIFRLWQIFFIAAIPVAGIVYGLIFWSVIRYRRRRSEDPDALGSQFRGNHRLELVYMGIPIIIVIGLFAASAAVEVRVDAVSPDPDVTVNVEAYRWGWRFTYPSEGVTIVSPPSGEFVAGPQMVLPVRQTTRIVLTANDVIHAFWVPDFLYKHDAIPGRTFMFDLTPTRTGSFYGECAEFCGLNHAYMTFSVRVVSPAEFATWLAQQRAVQQEAAA